VDIKATLKRKVGPLPVWAWGLVGAAGVGIGLALRRRGSSGDPLETGALVPIDNSAALPIDPFPSNPSLPFDPDLPTSEPLPGDSLLPWLDFPMPELFDCPEGYLYNTTFNTCVPDPAFFVTPDPEVGEVPIGPAPDRQRKLRTRIRHINRRIKQLRKGGLTARERARVQVLRRRRKRLRGRRS